MPATARRVVTTDRVALFAQTPAVKGRLSRTWVDAGTVLTVTRRPIPQMSIATYNGVDYAIATPVLDALTTATR